MKRRRQQLQVSTFPFLAVLLCAMGALILVLLSMDRKAKLAALAKAQEQERNQARLSSERSARVRAEKEAQSRKRDEHRRQHLDTEEKALRAELAHTRAQLEAVKAKLHAEEEVVRSLRQRLDGEQGATSRQEHALAAARRRSEDLTRRMTAAERERARLAAELVRLEAKLKDVLLARAKEPTRYSVVPYFGRQGADRRPVYIECASEGVIFHPDKKLVKGDKREELRGAVEQRLAAQKEAADTEGKGPPPYLMLLVRPDGIKRFYEMQALAHGLGVEMGYELIDAEWKLEYPPEQGPSRAAAPLAFVGPPRPRAQAMGSARPTAGVSGPAPLRVQAVVGLSRPLPFGSDPGSAPEKAPSGTSASKPEAPATGGGGVTLLPTPGQATQSPAVPAGRVPAGPVKPVGEGPAREQGPTLGPALDGPARKEEKPLRPAAISADVEVVLYVECRRDLVLVHPSGRRVPLDTLKRTDIHNPLLSAVKDLVARRQARAQPGSPALRVSVRFLVHRDGVETYHLAYPALGPLAADKKAFWLRPEDDVARIIAGR